jgi:hypothetical protein
MKTSQIISTLCLSTLICASLFSVGCASASKSSAMIPDSFTVHRAHQASVGLVVDGGQETNPMWTSQISNEAFRQALEASILSSGLFSAVLEVEDVDYLLQVELVDMEQPMMGFNMDVRLSADWRVVKADSKEVVFEQRVLGSHTATVGDAFAGVKRLRLANEGAARSNIQQGLERVSNLSL